MTNEQNLTQMTVAAFASATAQKSPTPGGGSVAGVVGVLGTALGEMALSFSRGKKDYAAHDADFEQIAARLHRARALFDELVAEDVRAYQYYQHVLRDEAALDRDEKLQLAIAAAIDVPREVQALSLRVLAELRTLVGRTNKWLISDLIAGAILLDAVVRMSDLNVRINAGAVDDKQAADEIRQVSTRDCDSAAALLGEIQAAAAGFF